MDAPHILQPADLAGFSASALGASEVAVNTSEPEPAELPRGWWTSNPERTVYTGVFESLSALGEVLSKGTFDVCMPHRGLSRSLFTARLGNLWF